MKVLLGILLITEACYASHHAYDHLCLRENIGYSRHPSDCHKFIRCSHQRAYEFICPANLLWHHEIKSCDFPYRTQCKLNDNESGNKISKKVNRNRKAVSGETFSKVFAKSPLIEHKKSEETKKLKRSTHNKQMYSTTKREIAKTADYIKNTVKYVTEKISASLPFKRTQPDNMNSTTTIYNPEKFTSPALSVHIQKDEENNKILTEKSFTKSLKLSFKVKSTENSLKEFNLKKVNNPTLNIKETTLKGFPERKDFLIQNTSDKTTSEEKKTISLEKLYNFINSMDSSFKSHDNKMAREEINLINNGVKVNKQQNSAFHKTAQIKYVTLNTRALEDDTNFINLTATLHPANFNVKTKSTLGNMPLTDNFTVKTAAGQNENEINVPLKSTASYNRRSTEFELSAQVISVNLTDTMLTSSATESTNALYRKMLEEKTNFTGATQLKSNLVTLSTLSLTDKSTIDTTNGENIDSTKYPIPCLNSTKTPNETNYQSITTEIAFEVTDPISSANDNDSVSTSYSTENIIFEVKTNTENVKVLSGFSVTSEPITQNSVGYSNSTANSDIIFFNSTDGSTETYNTLTEFEAQLTTKNKSVNLPDAVLTDYSAQQFLIDFDTVIQNDAISYNLTDIPVTSSGITENTMNYLGFADKSIIKLTDSENKHIISTVRNTTDALEISGETNTRIAYTSTEFDLQRIPNANSVNLADTQLTGNLKATTNYGPDKTLDEGNNNITPKSDIVLDFTTTKETSVFSTENLDVETTNHKTKTIPDPGFKRFSNNIVQTSKVSHQANTLAEAVTKMLTKNFNITKPTLKLTQAAEIHNNFESNKMKNFTSLSSGRYIKNQLEFSTSALFTTSHNYSPYYSTTQDPRLPFRSIKCQGPNNRIQFKANKCYQYYQCFAGWAFLLNCHDGWRFEAEEKQQCVLDVNQQCDSQ